MLGFMPFFHNLFIQEVNGERIYDRFRWALCRKYGYTCWEYAKDFNIDDHIKYMESSNKSYEEEWTEFDVFNELEKQQDKSLDIKSRSPWEILLIPNFSYKVGSGDHYYGLVFRLSHCLMDGISMGNILHDCLSDKPFQFSLDPIQPSKHSKLTVVIAHLISLINLPRAVLKHGLFFENNPIHNGKTLVGPKSFTWSKSIDLNIIKLLKNKSNTTIFSVLLSCLAGSVRNYFVKYNYN